MNDFVSGHLQSTPNNQHLNEKEVGILSLGKQWLSRHILSGSTPIVVSLFWSCFNKLWFLHQITISSIPFRKFNFFWVPKAALYRTGTWVFTDLKSRASWAKQGEKRNKKKVE